MTNVQSMICRVTDMYVSWKTEGEEEWEGKWAVLYRVVHSTP